MTPAFVGGSECVGVFGYVLVLFRSLSCTMLFMIFLYVVYVTIVLICFILVFVLFHFIFILLVPLLPFYMSTNVIPRSLLLPILF